MAKSDSQQNYREILTDVREGRFAPFYLLMGEEPFYVERLCEAIMNQAVNPFERDFNQIVYYGADVTAEQVISTARQFPMMGDHLLVVVKEAQMMSKPEDIAPYLMSPMPSTILVLCFMGKSIDKRTAFYKQAQKVGRVLESVKVQDYRLSQWIEAFFSEEGFDIEPEAAELMGEFTGNDLRKISVEVDKMRRNLPLDAKRITVADIEKNVGISREYSVFELTKALSFGQKEKAFRIASYFADSPKKYPIQMTIAALAMYFLKVWRYHSLMQAHTPKSQMAGELGVNPYFLGEYETAARNYPPRKVMAAIAFLKEYDYRSKSNERGDASDGDLLMELLSRLVS